MTPYLQHACLVALTGFLLSTCGKGLTFFNASPSLKQQRCNCLQKGQCGVSDGKCPGDRCRRNYIGTSCQHFDISKALDKKRTQTVHSDLLDGDDTTCVKHPSGKASFTLLKSIHYIWVYIYAKFELKITPQVVLYNKGNYTNNQFYSLRLSKKSLLIKSRNDVMFNKLELSALPEEVCSLEVSLGRNLALFAKTTPDYHESLVDGEDHFSYSYPGGMKVGITLPHEARVNMVFVHRDHQDCLFVVNSTTTEGKLITSKSKDNYVAVVEASPSVRNVTISYNCSANTFIGYDEVYIFGEFHCPKDTYGAYCDIDCPEGCSRETCDPDWACPQGCHGDRKGAWCEIKCPWKYGPSCQSHCAEACGGVGKCDMNTGRCLSGCKPGYIPPLCNATCPPGTYEVNCSKKCVQCMKNRTTDKHACDPTTGECLIGCGLGYDGEFCERLIVKDDNASTVTKVSIAVFVFLALVLLYRAHTRREEECSDEVGRKRPNQDAGTVNEVEGVKEHDDALQRDTTAPHGPVAALWGAVFGHVDDLDVHDTVNVFGHRVAAPETEPREEEEDKDAHSPRTPFWHNIFGPREARPESEQSDRSIQETANGAQPASAVPEKWDLDEALKDDVSTGSLTTESSVDEVVTGPVKH